MSHPSTPRPRKVADVCWRNLGALWGAMSWVIAAWVVDPQLGGSGRVDRSTRAAIGFLLVVVVWQLALDNANGCLDRATTAGRRHQICASMSTRASGAAIGLVLLVRLGESSPATIAEALTITLVSIPPAVVGLAALRRLRRHTEGEGAEAVPASLQRDR